MSKKWKYDQEETAELACRLINYYDEISSKTDKSTISKLKIIIDAYNEDKNFKTSHKRFIKKLFSDLPKKEGGDEIQLKNTFRKWVGRNRKETVQIEVSKNSRSKLNKLRKKHKIKSLDKLIPLLIVSKKRLKNSQ